MNQFYKYDTILAIRGDGEVFHKGFLVETFKSRFFEITGSYKIIYMIKNGENNLKKFYGKQKNIKIYSTRLVLTEKNNLVKKSKMLDFWEITF